MNNMKCTVDMANGLPCHWCVNYQWINIYSGLSNPRIIDTLPSALVPTLSVRHFGTSAELSGHQGRHCGTRQHWTKPWQGGQLCLRNYV